MSSTFSSCPYAHYVRNKYTGEMVYIPCGNCLYCRMAKGAILSARLETECSLHKYNLFFTLTYDNNHVPFAQRLDTFLEDIHANYYAGTIHDVDFLLDFVAEMYPGVSFTDLYVYRENGKFVIVDQDSYLGADFIPQVKDFDVPNAVGVLSKSDVQKFFKRLRRYIDYDKEKLLQNLSSEERKFRYYVCGEYGPTTLRPHYHGIIFCDSKELADAIKDFYIYKAWPLCVKERLDCQYIDCSASKYVSSYVSCSFTLPRLLQNNRVKPFQISSRKPALGVSEKSLSFCFEKISCGSLEYDIQKVNPNGGIEHGTKRLPVQVTNWLFPKCTRFQECRKSCHELFASYFPFFHHVSREELQVSPLHYDPDRYAADGTLGWYDENNILCYHRAMYVCEHFHLTHEEYIAMLLEYYKLKEQYTMSEFYAKLEYFSKINAFDELKRCYYAINHHEPLELLKLLPTQIRWCDIELKRPKTLMESLDDSLVSDYDTEKYAYASKVQIMNYLEKYGTSISFRVPILEHFKDLFSDWYIDSKSLFLLYTPLKNGFFLDRAKITSYYDVERNSIIQSERTHVVESYQKAFLRKKMNQNPHVCRDLGKQVLD